MTKAAKQRVDVLLVEQGLARSRTHAQALIMAGQVCFGDQLIKKPSEVFESQCRLRLKEGASPQFVSRGGEKMLGALKASGLNVSNFRVLDVGISTGGFTDCLLQNGAAQVVGLDVGHNQLDWKIKNDPRVTSHEGVNARSIPKDLPGLQDPFDLVVIDVSFISLTLVLSEALQFLRPSGFLLALIKPQFEVRKEQVGKGGIVKDPLLHDEVQGKIIKFCEDLGLKELNTFSSPIEGTDGNKEFFIFGRNS